MPTTKSIDAKAVRTGLKDALLMVLFSSAAYLVTYAVTLLPFLDTFQEGRYAWVKPVAALALGAAAKGLDRKKHEDSSDSTGLVKV